MENILPLRNLGNSGMKISPIGLGCWQFSKGGNWGGKFWPVLDDELILEIVRVSFEGGINWFDTAEMYGNGNSEKILARSLKQLDINPGAAYIATKWWPALRTASHLVKSFDKRQACLDPYPVDLYQVHQPFGFSTVGKEMKAMARLVKDKKIKYVGVSNFSAKQMRKAWETLKEEGISLVSNQVRYNLLERKIERNGILDTAKELGITIIAYSPLAQGLLTAKFHDNPELISKTGYRKHFPQFKQSGLEKSRPLIEILKKIAANHNVTPSQVALNWLVNYHGNTVVAIPGATKLSHAQENAGTLRFKLTTEEMVLLANV